LPGLLDACACAIAALVPVNVNERRSAFLTPGDVSSQFVVLTIADFEDGLRHLALLRAVASDHASALPAMHHRLGSASPLDNVILTGRAPLAGQLVLKPPVDEEFVTPSGGRLEEQRR
jgi:hypothetical protein